MAWYAKIENNKVVETIYIIDYLNNEWLYREFGGTWLKCSEDGSIRGMFPGVGYIYNREDDIFMPPQPFASWLFDRIQKQWVAPINYPNDGSEYKWNESLQQWILF